MVRRRDGGDRLPAELAAFDPRRWEDRADPPDARLRQAYRRWRWARVTWGLEHGDEALRCPSPGCGPTRTRRRPSGGAVADRLASFGVPTVRAADRDLVLAYVGRLLTESRQRCRRNGLSWPVRLEAAWLLATGRQEPPELDSGSRPPEVVAVSYAEAARRLAVSERTVQRLVRSGALPTVVIGGCPRIRVADLVGYIERRPVRPAACGADSSVAADSP